MPRVHVRAGADIGMEPAASAVAEWGAEGAPQGERAEIAGPVLGEDAAQGPGCPRRRGGSREGEEEVPLRLLLRRARRRAGPGTPAPSWKLEASPSSPDREGEVAMADAAPAPRRSSASASASARQLGASLWEIHDVTREGRRSGGRRRRSGNGPSGVGVDVDKNLEFISTRRLWMHNVAVKKIVKYIEGIRNPKVAMENYYY